MKKIIAVCVLSLFGWANVCFAKAESKGVVLEPSTFDLPMDFSAPLFGEEDLDLDGLPDGFW